MFQIAQGDARELADVREFLELINEPPLELTDFFDHDNDIFVSRSPGRLDVMGGIADYSGSLMLEMPIAEATFAAVQKSGENSIKIISLSSHSDGAMKFEIDLSEFRKLSSLGDYEEIKSFFASKPKDHWASYAAGVFFALARELDIDFHLGTRILISSNIPIGKGVSSSAALEVAVMNAVCAAFDIQIEPREIALLCQKVENLIVGAACGVMDQMSTNCGVENTLISILCQPAEIQGMIAIPDSIEFWGIDSGVRHSVAGSDYSSVRIAAFMGYRIISGLAGLNVRKKSYSLVEIDDPRWHGYLCNLTPDEYESQFRPTIPSAITGSEFIQRYNGITDEITSIDPSKTYEVKASTEHAIYENFRVRSFSSMLTGEIDNSQAIELGELMFKCHQSYAACGLTEPGTDRLAALAREYRSEGIYGARITGGGSGGTVCFMARRGSESVVNRIAKQYEAETGRAPYIFSGSSPGAARFGVLRLAPV